MFVFSLRCVFVVFKYVLLTRHIMSPAITIHGSRTSTFFVIRKILQINDKNKHTVTQNQYAPRIVLTWVMCVLQSMEFLQRISFVGVKTKTKLVSQIECFNWAEFNFDYPYVFSSNIFIFTITLDYSDGS